MAIAPADDAPSGDRRGKGPLDAILRPCAPKGPALPPVPRAASAIGTQPAPRQRSAPNRRRVSDRHPAGAASAIGIQPAPRRRWARPAGRAPRQRLAVQQPGSSWAWPVAVPRTTKPSHWLAGVVTQALTVHGS